MPMRVRRRRRVRGLLETDQAWPAHVGGGAAGLAVTPAGTENQSEGQMGDYAGAVAAAREHLVSGSAAAPVQFQNEDPPQKP